MIEIENEKMETVLLVDDSPENIYILGSILRPEYTVREAFDGNAALRMIADDSPPDIILLDVMMPGMDGYEVCQRIKANAQTANIPVIFVTASGEIEDLQKGLDLGGCDYISRPYSPPIIKARIRNHLALKNHRNTLKKLTGDWHRELEAIQASTVRSMAVLLAEYRDPETGGHIRRTQQYVRILTESLRAKGKKYENLLTDESLEFIVNSAPLHDIGKVAISDDILLKPGKLSDNEFQVMKKHTTCGYDVINATEALLKNQSSFFRTAKEIAHTHHEKWDGSGYPKGLAGEEIPLSGRIMAIADVYDALISKRIYKGPIPHKQAVETITKGRGFHFDPYLVGAFHEVEEDFRKIAYEFADFEEERQTLYI